MSDVRRTAPTAPIKAIKRDNAELRQFYCPQCDALAQYLVNRHGASEVSGTN